MTVEEFNKDYGPLYEIKDDYIYEEKKKVWRLPKFVCKENKVTSQVLSVIPKDNHRIVLDKCRHGTAYYDADTLEDLANVCVHILTEKFEQDYWCEPEKPKKSLDELIPLETVPEALQEEAKKKNEQLNRRWTDYNSELLDWQQIKSAIENKCGALAYEILRGLGHDVFEIEYLRRIEV